VRVGVCVRARARRSHAFAAWQSRMTVIYFRTMIVIIILVLILILMSLTLHYPHMRPQEKNGGGDPQDAGPALQQGPQVQ
jgi:hypothetical protein